MSSTPAEGRPRQPAGPGHSVAAAGAPLTTSDGHNLGTLCVIDREPRNFPEKDAATLAELAGVVMDEMELRLAARKADRMQQEFLSRMSHDLRTPLHHILGYGQILEASELDATQRDSLTCVLDGGRDLLALGHRPPRFLTDDQTATRLMSQAGFDGDLETRIPPGESRGSIDVNAEEVS